MRAGDGGGSFEVAGWVRNARVAAYVFMSVSALSGLAYLFYSACVGQVFRAIAGACIALGGVAVGSWALAAARLGTLLAARLEGNESFASRVEALENALQKQGVLVDLMPVSASDPQKLVAANLQRDGFPRLVRPGPIEPPTKPTPPPPQTVERPVPEEQRWQAADQNADLAACRRTLETLRGVLDPERITSLEEGLRAMSRAKAARLREGFAAMVRARNYAGALAVGEQIATLFPDSAMARQFATLRPRLAELAQACQISQSAPAV